jgi:hypothetical protein
MAGERDSGGTASGEPVEPSPLPLDLAEFLREHEVVCLMQGTDRGTVFVLKLPSPDIESARGTIPIQLRHELYAHPNAPVIRTILTLYDQTDTPLALETFTNVADENQLTDFAGLAQQEMFLLLFYDEQLAHRLTKVVPQSASDETRVVLEYAERILATIPADQFDFERARQAVMKATSM